MQAIQEVFTTEEWVKNVQNEARVEANLCTETSKALGAVEQKNQKLVAKLIAEERGRKNIETSLKNA